MTRIHRIYSSQKLQTGQKTVLTEDAAHYLSRVLRVTVGQSVQLFNGDGFDYVAEITGFEKASITLLLLDRLPGCRESPLHITLVQAISRGERMDQSLQKATELGVSAVQPVFSARTEVRLSAEKLQRRMQHWRNVMISACEQSGRACLPVLHEPLDVLVWAQNPSEAKRLMLVPKSKESLARISVNLQVELLVGPEGGFDERELDFLSQQGVQAVHLGTRILRTETAGPAAIAILQAQSGDLA